MTKTSIPLAPMSPIWDNGPMRNAVFHPRVRQHIREWPRLIRVQLGQAVYSLQLGLTLGMPLARPMSTVAKGAYELRLRDLTGQYRVFYLAKFDDRVLIFHSFVKKTQRTPDHEIQIGRARLKEMLK